MTVRYAALVVAFVVAGAVPASAQTPTLPDDVRAVMERAVSDGTEAARVLALYPPVARVPAGGNLQAALDAGPLIIELDPAVYTGSFRVSRAGTVLRGRGAHLHGVTGPGLYILPGTQGARISDLSVTADVASAIQCGDNVAATQSTIAAVPRDILFERVIVPTHRNRRGFEINCIGSMVDSRAVDIWDTHGTDSQAIVVLNTPGPWLVDGGEFSAGSEVFLAGGDPIKLAGAVIPSDLTLRNLRLFRPLSWRTDGVNRVVKNLFELKTGYRVRVQNVLMEGNWVGGQTGNAVVLTPRSGGAIGDVEFDGVYIRDTATCLQLTGHDLPTLAPTPTRTTGIVFRNSVCLANRATYGGRGILAEITMGPDTLDFDNMVFVGDGNQIVYVGDAERVGRVRFVNGFGTTGAYGFMGAGQANAANWTAWTDALEVTASTFTGAATALRTNLPQNTYVDRPTFDGLIAPRLR
jgi:hypothetical protein